MGKQGIGDKVQQIEAMELRLNQFNAARALALPDKKPMVLKLGDSLLLMETSGPESMYYNRVKGFGPSDLDKLDLILQEYESRDLIPCFDIPPGRMTVEVGTALHQKGFVCAEQLTFLEAGHGSPPTAPASSVEIKEVDEHLADDLLNSISRIMGGVPSEILERKKPYFILPHFRNYLAYIGNEIAGIGSLFIHEREGYLANDYTFPEYRGMGCQKALIARRLAEAAKLGLTSVYTDVRFGSASHENMRLLGFEQVFTTSFWIKA
ncbi:hypothetical protein AWM70_16135 [Paenibacillus yonginensis]|uniref:N-acetyltransferase domain-containing protein n=1 Tax=Paenibacillus yonginensis TaxID=1462996 RepID=A0A1B1N3E4_9BACL|nr:GNAT family N-acetyltransferase [Paenibacillus yonginensis]ANS75926.1 hypothetical protein AWM70_16135 [Paenibacillus yonginensis]